MLENSGLLFLAGVTNFTFLQSVEATYGPRKLYYPTGIGDNSSEVNVAGT